MSNYRKKYDDQKERSKTKNNRIKHFQAKAIELVYDTHVNFNTIIEGLKQKKYGVYKAFAKYHINDKNHTHIAVILREKPKIPFDKLKLHFKVGEVGPDMVQALGKGNTSPMKKMKAYVDYLTDGHDNGRFKDTFNYKYDYELTSTTKQGQVLVLLSRGLTREEIINQGDWAFRGWCMEQYTKFNTIIDNWRHYSHDETVYYKTTDFKDVVQEKLKDWDPKKQTLILKGPTGKGKTELAKAIAKDLTTHTPLLVRNLNLLAYKRYKQPIIFDDMNFNRLSRSKTIALTDIENDSSIRVLYGIANIEAGSVQILTTNEEKEDIFPYDSYGAIDRRLFYLDLTDVDCLYQ